jgi:hypothetical protein
VMIVFNNFLLKFHGWLLLKSTVLTMTLDVVLIFTINVIIILSPFMINVEWL